MSWVTPRSLSVQNPGNADWLRLRRDLHWARTEPRICRGMARPLDSCGLLRRVRGIVRSFPGAEECRVQDPFSQLMDEHRVIEQVLAALEAAAVRDVPAAFYEQALDFATEYADGYHHAKEEERLFTYLEERGMPRDYGPLGVMIQEHDAGRAHIRAMRAHLAEGDVQALRQESLAYALLMRDHIAKEDNVLFPMGRAMLTAEEIAEIQTGFDKVPQPSPSAADYVERAAQLLSSVTESP